jgi:hypothetical protein
LTILDTISDTYHVSCHLRYSENLTFYRRFFDIGSNIVPDIPVYPFLATSDIGFFADIGSDMYPILHINIVIYGYWRQKHTIVTISFPMWNQYCNTQISALLRYQGQKHDIGVDILPAAPPPPAGCTGHCPGAPTAPASWSSARLDSPYTIVAVLTPFPAVLHARLGEKCGVPPPDEWRKR